METQSQMREISAFFDSRADAEAAVTRLVDAGLPRDRIQMVEGNDTTTTTETTRKEESGGFMDALSNFFMPDDDRHTYAEGLERGGYLVSARVEEGHYDLALDILDDEGSIDMDARSQDWRSEGWSGQYAAADTGVARSVDTDRTAGTTGGSDDRIDVIHEDIRIGKRDVTHGRVRVRAYTVEDQVSEDVTLETETVHVERNTVDRPVSAAEADAAFRDRTIEVDETSEEAVISKDARVVEEIELHKDVDSRTETVEGTVRHTEVEIDDDRGTKPVAGDVRRTEVEDDRR